MAVPSGVYIHMYTIQEAITTLKDVVPFAPPGQVPSPRKALLLLKAPQTALALFKGGVSMTPWGGKGPHLNVGNIAAAPGRKRVFRSISLGPEQAAALDALAAQGVRITFQSTPDDAQADWQATRQGLANALAR
jgi:mannose/fructose/N-acetylgalactosamine-specific phosphotransferase system component IIB